MSRASSRDLVYYAHRFHDDDLRRQCDNLRDAILRFRELRRVYLARGQVLWAPWIEMAMANGDEKEAWLVIEQCVRICDGIVLDLDGDDEPSPGMIRERAIAVAVGAKVEVVR